MLLPCNFQGKAARFALLASVGGHGERKLTVAPAKRKAEKFAKPETRKPSDQQEK
ncbi:hypothetical protein ACSAZK_04320 [Methanosarcina sp. Mfa9]|uniref:hypothetical protein n=1 Tax=Methanosarcina sp. Mfa9 TaxID=3439063 RepID=UPI003F87679F